MLRVGVSYKAGTRAQRGRVAIPGAIDRSSTAVLVEVPGCNQPWLRSAQRRLEGAGNVRAFAGDIPDANLVQLPEPVLAGGRASSTDFQWERVARSTVLWHDEIGDVLSIQPEIQHILRRGEGDRDVVPEPGIDSQVNEIPTDWIVLAASADSGDDIVLSDENAVRSLGIGVPIALRQDLAEIMVEAVRIVISEPRLIPFRATAFANVCESSSILQPVLFTAVGVVFVTSNQSAASGLFPLDHGATSEITIEPAADAGTARIDAKAATRDRRMITLAIVRRPRTRR